MTKAITSYLQMLEHLEKEKKVSQKTLDAVLVHIQFFQHERLIHLIVTMSISLLTIGVSISFILYPTFNLFLLLLFILLACLLVPYLFHYYFLENSVQKMYQHYDALEKKL